MKIGEYSTRSSKGAFLLQSGGGEVATQIVAVYGRGGECCKFGDGKSVKLKTTIPPQGRFLTFTFSAKGQGGEEKGS